MTDDRIAALEARLQALEDERAITRLIASYGPLVDAGCADEVAGLWTEDGVYDVDEYFMGSRADIHAMVESDAHQGLIRTGATHFLGPAHVTVEGDEARAICASILLVRHKGRTITARAAANLWRLVRTGEGWQVTRRTTRALDGRDDARRLLAAGVTGRHLPEEHR